jgi:AcrR family transcriptional regulator
MEKQSYHHGDLKAELISAGIRLLSEEGYEAFSLRRVAKECGVSQAAPYRHFKDKDTLVMAIITQALEAFNERLTAAVDKHPDDPRSQIKEMGVAYIRFFAEHPDYLRVMFLSDVRMVGKTDCSEEKGAHLKAGHPFAVLFNAVRAYCLAYPDYGMNESELLVMCWGLVHGISVLLTRGELPFTADFESLVSGIIWNEHFL